MNVKLSDIIDGLECQSMESHWLVNTQSGEVYLISDEAMSMVEEGEESSAPAWMNDMIDQAKQCIAHPEHFIELPKQDEVNEYAMMEAFAEEQADEHVQDKLFIALSGKGAFRRFKDTVQHLDLSDAWYACRDAGYRQFALAWCQQHRLSVDE